MIGDTATRLLAVWDHLGLGVAHVATQMAGDVAGLAQAAPERLGGIVLCVPARLDPAPFARVAERVMLVSGEYGLTAGMRLPGASRVVLAGYDAPGWADVVADRTDEIVAVLSGLPDLPIAHLPQGDGTVVGISTACRTQENS